MNSSSSSLFHLHSNSKIHHTNNDHSDHFSSHHAFDNNHTHLSEFLAHSDNINRSKPDQLTFNPLPLPNFLIDPQDGQFTPYFERSPASSPGHEYDDPMDSCHNSQPSSPIVPISPLRSRATSIALKKLIEIQAQKLLDISAAWKKKYPADEVEFRANSLLEDPAQQVDNHHDQQEEKEEEKKVVDDNDEEDEDNIADLSTPKPNLAPATRHLRSTSHKSTTGCFSALFERLSLNDYHTTRDDVPSHTLPPPKSEVENWKREVLESKLRLQATKEWILSLPTIPNQFDQIPFDLNLQS